MTRKAASGAELGSLLEINGSSVGVAGVIASSTAQTRGIAGGLRSWHMTRTGAAVAEAENISLLSGSFPANQRSMVLRCSFFIPVGNTPGGTGGWQASYTQGANSFIFQMTVSAAMNVTISFGTLSQVLASGLAKGVWHDVVAEATTSATTGTRMVGAVNDLAPIVSSDGTDRGTAGIPTWGLASSTVNDEIFLDDLCIDTDGVQASWVSARPFMLFFVQPNGAGPGPNQWANIGGAASKPAAVSDDNDVTLIQATGTSRLRETFSLGTLPTGLPANPGIVAYFGARFPGITGTAATVELHIVQGGTDLLLVTQSSALTAATRDSWSVRLADANNTTWTVALWNSGTILMNYPAGQLTTAIMNISEIWVYVEVLAVDQVTDTLTVTDAAAGIRILVDFTALTSIATLTETLTALNGFTVNAAASLTDTIPGVETRFSLNDSQSVSDLVTAVCAGVPVNMPLTLTETLTALNGFTVNDNQTVTDLVTLIANRGVTYTDSQTVTDSVTSVFAVPQLSDPLALTEVLFTPVGFVVAEALTLSEVLTGWAGFTMTDSALETFMVTSVQKFGGKRIVLVDDRDRLG